jgi:hypothetical protein
MTRRLLAIIAAATLISIVSFAMFGALGGFKTKHRIHINARDDGPNITRDLAWSGGETLHIDNSAAHITFVQGATPKITVTGPKRRVDKIGIDGDTLTGTDIEWGLDDDDHSDEIAITITSPNTHRFFLSGAENFTLTNFDQDSLNLNISGAAHIMGIGKAKSLEVDMSGAGRMDLAQLPVEDARLSISGAGDATLDAKQSAKVSISGAGHVRLVNKPADLQQTISGIGSISVPDGAGTAGIGSVRKDVHSDASGKTKT